MSEENTEQLPHVLVVDDSRVIRIAARKILSSEFAVSEAGDGEAAWEQLTSDDQIALVISDLSMPYLDGMGLLRRMRSAEDTRIANIPVIIVTGAEDDEDAKSSAFAAGASDFLTKPFDSVQLLAHTRSHIKLVETESRLAQTETAIESEPTTDSLTGLFNQRTFNERGQQELSYAIRHRSDLALAFINIDGFDQVFVRFGRPAGEAILKGVAEIVKDNVRKEDTAGRVGLARFGLILPSANPVGARQLAVRICQQIAARIFEAAGKRFKITASAGVVTPLIRRDTSLESLLADGQRFIERATRAGGNRVVYDQTPAANAGQGTPEKATPATTPGEPEPTLQSPPSTPPKPDIATALARIRAQEHDDIVPHLDALLREVLPLLELWNQQDNRSIDVALTQIRSALDIDN